MHLRKLAAGMLLALALVALSAPAAALAEEAPLAAGVMLEAQTEGIDDYPEYLKKADRDSLIDPWRFYNRECTSFTAWRLNNDNGVDFTCFYKGVRWGNANEWGEAARSVGIAVDNTPVKGSVAWWSTGALGHVAWVRSVNGDTVNIEEYNLGDDGKYYQRTIPASDPTGYIHIKDLTADTAPIGYLDECTCENGLLRIRGWAYDPDSPDKPISLHVYVGGQAGEGACYTVDATGSEIKSGTVNRPDVGGMYGYDCQLSVAETGRQKVYVYALNNEEGDNPVLQNCPATVKIEAEKDQPVITPKGAGVAMYRMYNPNSGEHFYTANVEERNALMQVGWYFEGIGWIAPEMSETPVYRLYNPNAGEHHYTIGAEERDALVATGWVDEGTGWYSDDAKSVCLYRQYNPYQFACNHNYTHSKEENDSLVAAGWAAEGIGWYGIESAYPYEAYVVPYTNPTSIGISSDVSVAAGNLPYTALVGGISKETVSAGSIAAYYYLDLDEPIAFTFYSRALGDYTTQNLDRLQIAIDYGRFNTADNQQNINQLEGLLGDDAIVQGGVCPSLSTSSYATSVIMYIDYVTPV